MRRQTHKLHQSSVILPNGKRPEVSTQHLRPHPITNRPRCLVHLPLNFQCISKESRNLAVRAQRQITQQHHIFPILIRRGNNPPRRIHVTESSRPCRGAASCAPPCPDVRLNKITSPLPTPVSTPPAAPQVSPAATPSHFCRAG